jgi:hypothetical protein
MAKFMFVFRGGGYASKGAPPSPTELQAHLGRWNAWSESLMKAGKLDNAAALSHPPTGKTVRGTAKTVTDGPYAETKDLVSGIVVVNAASIDEAAELARGCPILEHEDGSVEVRPVLERPAG